MGCKESNQTKPTLVDLTSNFSVLCTYVKVYLYNYSLWMELNMNIHEGKG